MGLHDWACVHEGGGRWVGSNKLVDLKKKKNKLKIELLYNPAILLLVIYLDKTIIIQKEGTPVFIAAQFTKAKTWKHPIHSLVDEWIKKMWYIYTMEYYSVIKENRIMPFAETWIQLEIIILSEIRQKEKNMISLICGI